MEWKRIALEPQSFPGNREALEDFEGLTPNEMHGLLHFTFDEERSPLVFDPDAAGDSLAEVRLVKDATSYLRLVRDGQPLKLTPKGNLPRKLCRELVKEGLVESRMDRNWFEKHPITKEADSYYIRFLNLLCNHTGLTRKSKGRLYLTRKAENLMGPDSGPGMYRVLFVGYARKLNWGYFDGYPEAWIIQAGFGFTIKLVQIYGDVSRKSGFYKDRFLKAFPAAIDEFPDTGLGPRREQFAPCYHIRSFERFMARFGLAEVSGSDPFSGDRGEIVKTDLVDRIFRWKKVPGPEVDLFFTGAPAS